MTISEHRYTAQVSGVPLSPNGGEVTVDESWSPYAQATLTCPVPPDDVLALLDPRMSPAPRVQLSATQRFVSSRPVADVSADWAGLSLADMSARLVGRSLGWLSSAYGTGFNPTGIRPSRRMSADLTLRRRSIDHVTGRMTIDLASDEALAQDYRLVSTAPVRPAGSSVRAAVQYALALIGAHLSPGTADGAVSAESMLWQPGVSAWEYLSPLVQAAGLRLWCDESRVWRLTDPLAPTEGALALSASTATTVEEDLSRESRPDATGWYDAVVVRYRWIDAAGTTQTRYDIDTRGAATSVLTVELERPYPGPGAARAILRRTAGRGRVLAVSAVSDYQVRPGAVLTVTVPPTPVQTGLVSRVSWSWDSDTMHVRSRDLVDTPATAWARIAPGVAWADIPSGMSWQTLTPDDLEA